MAAAQGVDRAGLERHDLGDEADLGAYLRELDAARVDTSARRWLAFGHFERGYDAALAIGNDSLTAEAALRAASYADQRGWDSGLPVVPLALEAVTRGERYLSGRELAKAYGMLGRASTHLGDLGGAASYFKRTVELAGEHEPEALIYPLRRLARVCLHLGDTACAESAMERALRNPAVRDDTWRAMYLIQINRRLVEIYAARGQWSRVDSSFAVAEAAWQEGRHDVRNRHFNAELRPAQVRCELMRGDLDAAHGYVDSLAQTHPNFALVHRSYVLAEEGDSAAAYATFLEARFASASDRIDHLPHAIALAAANGDYPAALSYGEELRGVQGRRVAQLQQNAGSLTEAKLAGMVRERSLEAARARAELANARRSARLKQSAVMAVTLLLLVAWLWRRQRSTARERGELERRVAEQTAELAGANDALALANQRLEARVDDLARFNFLLSHDLREPVRSIVSFAALAQRHAHSPARLADDLAFVAAGARQLSDLLDGIEALRAADDHRPARSRVDVVAAVRERLRAAQRANPAARLSLSAATPDSLAADTDADSVGRVVGLLVDNAVRFAGERPAEAVVEVAADGAETVVRVRDVGLGFEWDLRELVFAAFQRMHRREDFPGAGIGLTLGRRLAESLGGTLTCTRAGVGLGCTFELRFARWAGAASAETRDVEVSAAP